MRIAIFVLVFALTGVGLLYVQPRWILGIAGRLSGDRVLFFVETERPFVALTIDDGPDPETTAKILAVLDRHQAKATFFPIGSHVEGNETVVAEMVAAGHELGNHMLEDRLSAGLPIETFASHLKQTESSIVSAAKGLEGLHWFRPGQGLYTQRMLDVAEAEGYRAVLGSVFPYDTLLGQPGFSARFIRDRVRPGSIIVLHDRGERGERTAIALEILLPQLADRGYRVTTLSELVESGAAGSTERVN
ncbi:polysaccharide deacetylase family protein [Synechococcus sp. PCC 7336]|uniref:polysaccharide deacetylase family protein n=1 Tax=Synechococcus sp. PCC 7336 TaxID=195250 RepID=UPI0003603073|nr:polysaccharide deacetylase family protein [Synechococcus sp. PCC 7336]